MRNKISMIFLLIVFALALVSCGGDTTIQNTAQTTLTQEDTSQTTLRDFNDLEERLYVLYELVVETNSFNGTFDEWLDFTGAPSDSSKEVQLRIFEDALQWKYADSDVWVDLIAVNTLTGVNDSIVIFYIDDHNDLMINYENNQTINLGEIELFFKVIFYDIDHNIVDTQYVKYGSDAIAPVLPEVEGYNFIRWNVSFTDISINTTVIPEYSLNQYILNLNTNGGSILNDLNFYYGEEVSISTIPTREGYRFDGWYLDPELTEPFIASTMPSKDFSIYAKWIVNQYTISFEENDGSEVTDVTQDYNTSVAVPAVPTNYGYRFAGWYEDSALTIPYTFTTMPAENITLYAKWVENLSTISFISNGGNLVDSITAEVGEVVSVPTNPERQGYDFAGWYSDSDLSAAYAFNVMPEDDITLYADWSPNEYTVNYVLNDDDSNVTILTRYAGTELYIPIREGYTFAGWYEDALLTQVYSENTFPVEDMILYAKWTVNQYTVNYVEANGNFDPTKEALLKPGEIIIYVRGGGEHAGLLTSYGRVFMWGLNNDGQLGDGSTTNYTYPIDITGAFNLDDDERIVSLELGNYFSMALTSKGRVFTWGDNLSGQIGDGTYNNDVLLPKDITAQFFLLPAEEIIMISASGSHAGVLTSQGRVFTWGFNSNGELGDNTTNRKLSPVDITSNFTLTAQEKITSISFGTNHSSAITSDGRLFMWGSNFQGQLGINSLGGNSLIPVDITANFSLNVGEKILQASLGGDHTLAVTTEGRVFSWGNNSYGQLGLGTWSIDEVLVPTEITHKYSLLDGETIVFVEAAEANSASITSLGRLHIWGANHNGQNGSGDEFSIAKNAPVSISGYLNLSIGEEVTQVSFGNSNEVFTLILTSENIVYGCGINDVGQLALEPEGEYDERYSPIELAIKHSAYGYTASYDFDTVVFDYIPTRDGYLFDGWYEDSNFTIPYSPSTMPANDINVYGRWILDTYNITYTLDPGTSGENPLTYTYESEDIILEIPFRSGYTFAWYDNPAFTGDPITIIAHGSFDDIDLYGKWTIITYDITYYLNDGTNSSNPSDYTVETTTIILDIPTRAGYTFDGWYEASDFSGTEVTEIANGSVGNLDLFAKWILDTYTITYNLNGGVNGTNPGTYTVITPTITLEEPTREGYTFGGWYLASDFSGSEVTGIVLGSTDNLELYAKWTINQYTVNYAIISDDYDPLTDILLLPNESIIQIELGTYHTVVVTSAGRVFSWGYNMQSQLGDGTNNNSSTPVNITSNFNLTDGEKVIYIAVGSYHNLAVTSQGRVFTWGTNSYGILGNNSVVSSNLPIDITNNFNLNVGETITSASLGEQNSAVLTSDGRLFKWGRNDYGQLGDSTSPDSYLPLDITSKFNLNGSETIIKVSLGHSHSAIITSEGRVFTWGGDNFYGTIGNATNMNQFTPVEITSFFNLNALETIEDIAVGGNHMLAITSDGRVFAWGKNTKGQLGNNTETNSNIPLDITSYLGLGVSEEVARISLGYESSSVLTTDSRLLIWGYNQYGNIGDGTAGWDQYKTTPTDITSQFTLDVNDALSTISISRFSSSCISSDGRVFTWGYNSYGQLGDNSTTDRYIPVEVAFYTPTLDSTVVYDYDDLLNYIPTNPGYTFDGWYTNPECSIAFTLTNMPDEDLILYGKWIQN